MKKTLCLWTLGLVIFAGVVPAARAVLRTEVVVLLGAELSDSKPLPDAALLAKHGLDACTTPSISWDDDQRPKRHFVGQRLGSLSLYRRSDGSLSLPVPTPEQVKETRAALERAGISAEPRLLLVLQSSGGK
jgi:hypothetical protein